MIEFVCASHNEEILTENLLKSPILKHRKLTVQKDYDNIPKGYNAFKASSPIIIYCHHDVFLPEKFEDALLASLFKINTIDKNWGVLGVAGVRLESGLKKEYGYILDRGNSWGHPNGLPAEVQTLDELILITKGDFKFDENLSQDFYGADICLQARQQGRKCYAIRAYCHHNSSRQVGGRTASFYESEKKFYEKWKNSLPIVTTTSIKFK